MDRIVGIETEYGCLLSEEEPHVNSELWPAKVKNYLFRKAKAGTIDLHYRDYEEPPGNGGFLLNGGRLYLDMGHIEYASPECLHLHDIVTYELAGDDLLQSSLAALGADGRVSFIKNNVDHYTGATFGCHENYLMKREAQFTPPILGTLLTFLATRQIFTGAGRVGQSNPLAFDFEPPQPEAQVNFQLSQRADHIVNDIYQWVQFNRFYRYSRMAACRETLSWPMPCKAPAIFHAIPLNGGLSILKTARPFVRSTCSGNSIN